MLIKKISKYLLISAAIIFFTCLIISLFYIRVAYRALIANENRYPAFVSSIINKITNQKPKPLIIAAPEKTLRILEAWTNKDISLYVEREMGLSATEFLTEVGLPQTDYRSNKNLSPLLDFSTKYSFLADKPEYFGLEGYLFPDTYRVYASSTVTEVIEKMLSNFDKKLTQKMRDDIKAQGKTIYEVITLASIVEKEAPINYQTKNNRDARIIAGIFLNRLSYGQGLESDATLSYIYGDTKPAHSGEELEANSLYNTYKYRGLPPGPICNPGILAIEAAIYPIKTDYNYFLSPKGKDEVIYARTYQEHLNNKYKYLK